MKTIIFISHEDSKFGAPKSLMELIYSLKNEYSIKPIVLLHSKDDVYDFCEKNGIEKYVVRHRNLVCGRKSEVLSHLKKIPKDIINRIDDYRAFLYIKEHIDMEKVDIIHSNVTITTLGMLLRKKFGIPHVVHLRETASNVENYVYTRNYVKTLLDGADYFIAISDFTKREWIKRGIPENRIETIYNGLNLDFTLPNKSDYKEDSKLRKIRIVFSGALSKDKGQLDLIEAVNIMPDIYKKRIQVEFIGEGELSYTKYLKDKVLNYGLSDSVKFLGYISQASNLYRMYDIGIIGSRAEAFGRVTVEYMASGLAVIASDAGANPELIKDGVNGLLYESGNSLDLVQKIKVLMDNPDIVKKLSYRAKDDVYKRFTTKINANNVFKLYTKITKG